MSSRTYHSSSYHYRRTPIVVIGVCLTLICAFFFCRLLPEWLAVLSDPKKLLIGLFPIGVLSLLAFVGIMLIRWYVTDHSLCLHIDTDGVNYAGRHYSWTDVGALSGRLHGSRVQLLLHRRGKIALDRHLQTDNGLSEAEFETLMKNLEDDLSPLYPHLKLG
jgi:hypothetical protein